MVAWSLLSSLKAFWLPDLEPLLEQPEVQSEAGALEGGGVSLGFKFLDGRLELGDGLEHPLQLVPQVLVDLAEEGGLGVEFVQQFLVTPPYAPGRTGLSGA